MRFVLIGFLASLLSLKLIEIDLVEPKDLIAGDKAEFACWTQTIIGLCMGGGMVCIGGQF